MARPICLRLLTHWMRRAASRAACTAGSSRAINTAIMAITTSSSIKVNAERSEVDRRACLIWDPPRRFNEENLGRTKTSDHVLTGNTLGLLPIAVSWGQPGSEIEGP